MTVNKILPEHLQTISQETLEESLSGIIDLVDRSVSPHISGDFLGGCSRDRECVRIALYIIQTLNLDFLLSTCEAQETFNKKENSNDS